ncbi:YceI family protein [Luteimonas sp. YGD11-2]|uniref:YceI family protein n=1 Tax=Luteimonas sp. YGD11-2 TaxID=2508168 RepID=UPI00100A8EDC|nr:YceI family protein [Luteimonas sp. YGD11-2]
MHMHSRRFLQRSALVAALAVAAGAAFAAPVTYTMDPSHTTVVAKWNHFGFSNPVILFGDAEGRIVHDADDVSASSVQVTLPLSGLESNVPAFNDHLLSDDFFDAEKFPQATFRSTSVEAAGEGKLKVTGDLTIKDITREVVLDTTINTIGAHPMSRKPTAGFDAKATIKRSDFGLGMHVPHVADEIELHITTEASVAAE